MGFSDKKYCIAVQFLSTNLPNEDLKVGGGVYLKTEGDSANSKITPTFCFIENSLF